MTALKILICGGGLAGPSLAFWLSRGGHHVTVIERSPSLRASGAQIDLRRQGITIMRQMGLLDAVRANRVHEDGFQIVDSDGSPVATFGANTSGSGAQSLTSEYEIMRGDLVRILYDATKDRVSYVFGKTVESYEQDEDKVTVHLSDNTTDTFDVLVGADGQGSRVRQSMLPGIDPYRRLGVHGALWIVPRREEDTSFCKVYLIPGGRMVMYRSHSATESHCSVGMRDDADLSDLYKAPIDEQKEFWAQKFADAGWQTPRLLEVLKTTDTFYSNSSVQVSIETLYKDRVVLVGDAGYCPSSLTGRGTTGAFVGSYILAGEILRHSDDLPTAFANYNNIMRPFIDDIQKFNPSFLKYIVPETQWGIKTIHTLTWFICLLRIPQLMARFSSPDVSPWKMPEYPELK